MMRFVANSLSKNSIRPSLKAVNSQFTVNSQRFFSISHIRQSKYGDTWNFSNSKNQYSFNEMDFGKEEATDENDFLSSHQKTIIRKPLSYTAHSEVESLSMDYIASWRKEHTISIENELGPNPILSFDQVPFKSPTVDILKTNYSAPLPIQAQTWPIIMSGRNIIGSAKTGSGKTLAFALPALEYAAQQPRSENPCVLILAPTRELVQQIENDIRKYIYNYHRYILAIFGGQGNRLSQLRSLSKKPQVIVATPGRLMDFVNSGLINIRECSYFVLDEADRMLDMGFEPQVREICSFIPEDRQTLMFSATWPKKVRHLAQDFFSDNHVWVNIGSEELSANPDISQKIICCGPFERGQLLLKLLKDESAKKILLFVATKIGCEMIGQSLFEKGFNNFAVLHGDKEQRQRDNILKDFKSGALKLVIATDVASRGIDIKDIDIVVNYDMPKNIEDYIHRIGRTGRAGNSGRSITFFTPSDHRLIKELLDVLHLAKQPIPSELTQILKDQLWEKQQASRPMPKKQSSYKSYR